MTRRHDLLPRHYLKVLLKKHPQCDERDADYQVSDRTRMIVTCLQIARMSQHSRMQHSCDAALSKQLETAMPIQQTTRVSIIKVIMNRDVLWMIMNKNVTSLWSVIFV